MSYVVMIVDDDAELRADVKRLLGAYGCQVIEAGTGRVATKALETCAPDLIVVDGLLPDTDGPTWIAQRRAAGRMDPIVFLSAFWKDLASFQQLTAELGVVAVIHKPIDCHDLTVRLCEILTKVAPDDQLAEVDDDAVEQLLRSASAEYARNLPTKIGMLRRAVERSLDHPQDLGLLRDVRTQAHKLSGTAGAYGFAKVGDAARDLEEMALRVEQGGRVATFDWARGTQRLEQAFSPGTLARVGVNA